MLREFECDDCSCRKLFTVRVLRKAGVTILVQALYEARAQLKFITKQKGRTERRGVEEALSS